MAKWEQIAALWDLQVQTKTFAGELQIWNVEEGIEAVTTCKAHEGMINSVSGCQDAEVKSVA